MEIAAEPGLGTTLLGNLMIANRPLATPAVLAIPISRLAPQATLTPWHAVLIHIYHLNSVAPSFEHIAGARHSAESRHRKTAERVVVLALILSKQRLRVDRSQYGVEVKSAVH
jgi:hypothetical protein